MASFKRVRLINPRRRRRSNRGSRRARAANGRFLSRARARARRNARPRRRINVSRTRRRNRRASATRSSRPRARATRRRKNPLGEELILLSNPRRTRRARKANYRPRRRRRSNPRYIAAAPRHRRRSYRRRSNPRRSYRRNPGFASGGKNLLIEGAKGTISAAISSVVTRAGVQAVLGKNNTGAMGYAANLFLAFAGGWLIHKFSKSASLSIGWVAGGAASTVQRIWSENVSHTNPAPPVAAMSGMGDLDYSSNGLGHIGLTGYVNTGFALPSVTGADGSVQPAFAPQLPAVNAAQGSGQAAPANVQRYAARY